MTFKLTYLAIVAGLLLPVLALPASESGALGRRGAEGEPFDCPDPGATAAAKQALTSFGALPIDLAIAMLENGCAFTAAYGIGNNKQADSAEIGVYRNNWGMIRMYCDDFMGRASEEWSSAGSEIHNNVQIATKCQRQLMDKLGESQYYSLQRGGQSNQQLGGEYGNFVQKYLGFLNADSSRLSDGVCTWWYLVGI